MPLYLFRCTSCGDFDRFLPMGRAGDGVACDGCGGQARRAFTAPGVRSSSPVARRAIEGAEATADAPAVVDRVPPAARRAPRRFDARTGFAPRPAPARRDGRYQPLPTG